MKRLLLFLTVLFLSGIVVASAIFVLFFVPTDRADTTEKLFIIERGSSVSKIAAKLQTNGFVRSQFAPYLMLRGSTIQAGSYKLERSQTPLEIAHVLQQGANDQWVTLLEGWRVEEYAQELSNQLTQLPFDQDFFLSLAKKQEGMLFPDTYLIPHSMSEQMIVDLLTRTFEKKYAAAVAELGEPTLPKQQTIILASLIQREARDTQDMNIVAGILMNRIKLGMPLQVDATLQYQKGYSKSLATWWQEPKSTDRATDTPYNTYKYKGLPPTPISNPGVSALRAAIKPATTDYLFYISDRQGVMHYAHTLAEHDAMIDKYLR